MVHRSAFRGIGGLRFQRIVLVAAVCLAAMLGARAAAQPSASSDARFLAGLRERQIFSPAEAYCRRVLAESYLSERRRTELTVELARTVLESALYARPPERERRFAAAAAVVDDAARSKSGAPWTAPLVVQRGIVDLVRGERLREEAQALHHSAPGLAAAREPLRTAAAQLRAARTFVAEQLREAHRRRPPTPDLPTPAELTALDRHATFQLARAYRNLGESYPPQSPDRTSAVEQALETLAPLMRSETIDGVTWQARLDEVGCRKLLGDLDGADKMLTLLDGQSPPSDVADRARAERIRIRLAAGDLAEARKYVREDDAEASRDVAPEVRLAVLEWLAASAVAADAAGRKEEGTDLRRRTTALAGLIAERHSAYWARRAEALAAGAVAAAPATDDVRQLLRAAETFYGQGNVDRALEVYDQAFLKAQETKQSEVAFQAGFTAAAVEQQRGRCDAAARRFGELAGRFADHPRIGEVRLAAAFNLAQGLTAANGAAETQAGLARYEAVLAEQIAAQPHAPATSQARWWLGRLQRQRGRNDEAAELFAAVDPSHPAAVDAVRAYATVRDEQLAELRRAGLPLEGPLDRTRRQLQTFAPDYPQPPPGPATPVVRAATTALAALDLCYGRDRSAAAEAALATMETAADASEEERRTIAAWRLAALVGGKRFDEAASIAARLEPPAGDDAARIATYLLELAAALPDERRKQAATFAVKLLESSAAAAEKLSAEPYRRRIATEANALALAGRTDDARRAFESWTTWFPSDVEARQAFAEFWASQPDAAAQTAAVAKWREVERLAPEASPRWYRARLGTAEAYERLGDQARALQIARLTAALHPDLGGPELRGRFLALEERLGK